MEQEGIAVVEEVHSPVAQTVDCCHLTPQRLLHGLAEALRFFGHHAFAIFQTVSYGVIAARPGVVERCLVAAKVDTYTLVGQPLPEVHHVTHVCKGYHLLVVHRLAYAGDEFVKAVVQFVHPALVVTLPGRQGIDFRRDRDHSGDIAGLRLGAAHSAETGGDEKESAVVITWLHLPRRIHHGDGGTVHYSLRTDIHVGAGGHLAILAHAQGVKPLPIIRLGVVRYDHSVGHHHPRRIFMAWEQAERMAGVHHQRLLVSHGGKVLHGQQVLRPILENRSVAAVDYEFVRMLRNPRIQIVLDHRHNGCRLPGFRRILIYRTGVHRV